MNSRYKRGFSLIELVFVIALLAIIISIVIVTYPGLVQRMQLRADRASASYITKALRTWYIDAMSDESKRDDFKTFISENMITGRVSLKSLENKNVGIFVDPNYKPKSLRDSNDNFVSDQNFYVGLVGDGNDSRFVITIETDTKKITDVITSTSVVGYDGTDVGIIYIES